MSGQRVGGRVEGHHGSMTLVLHTAADRLDLRERGVPSKPLGGWVWEWA